MTLIFDTGSNQLWVPTTGCASCHSSNLYDTSTSTAYKRLSNTIQKITYGKGEVEGYLSQDQVQFQTGAVIPEMELLAVTAEKDFQGTQADGILGLAPLKQQGQPPYLLDTLKNNGLISSRILSFILRYETNESVVQFGEPDYSLAVSFSKNASLSLIDKGVLYFTALSSASINNQQIQSSDSPALFDTGTSLLAMPQGVLRDLLKYYISEGVSIQYSQGLFTAPCNQVPNYPLEITIDEYIFSIPFSKFWQQVGIYSCFLLVQEAPFWILGDVFLRQNYVVIDYDAGKLRVYGANIRHIDDPTPHPDPFPYGIQSSDSYLAAGWIVLVVLAYIVVAVGATFILEGRLRTRGRRNVGGKEFQLPLEMGKKSAEVA